MQKKWIIAGLLFFLSRLIFINSGPVFFDSPEYLERLSNPNFYQALVNGHRPLHAGYVFVYWPLWHFTKQIGIDPGTSILVMQIILSFLGLIAFYQIVKQLTTERIAYISSILISLTPLFWASNVTIMMETTYVSTFFLALLFFSLFLKSKSTTCLILGSVLLFLSLITHIAPLLYFPFAIYAGYLLVKKYKSPFPISISVLISLFVVVAAFSIINAFLINTNSISEGLRSLYFGKTQEASVFQPTLPGIMRLIRNWIIPILRNETFALFCISLIGIFLAFKNNKKLFFLGILWLSPTLLVNQWADSLWYGRHAFISYFGFTFFAGYALQSKQKVSYIILIYLLVVSVPALVYLRKPIPYIQIRNVVSTLPQKSFYIESHYARPQIEMLHKNEVYFVNEPRAQGDLKNVMDTYLREGTDVYISSQALSEPYGLYSGPYIHILSLSYKNPFTLQNVLDGKYGIEEYKVISRRDNIIIYKITKNAYNFRYPHSPKLIHSPRRIDYYDPVIRMWLFLEEKSQGSDR